MSSETHQIISTWVYFWSKSETVLLSVSGIFYVAWTTAYIVFWNIASSKQIMIKNL